MAVALIVLTLLAPIAMAMPGDPPIKALSPKDGASIPATDLGIKVTFACPAYSTDIENEGEDDEKKVAGSIDDYEVHFSTGTTRGPDGVLTTAGFGEDGEGLVDPGPEKGTCSAELSLPEGPVPVALYSGVVHWQAFRTCDGCDSDQYETGPVSAFTVTPDVEEPELNVQDHVYAGYLTRVAFSTGSDLGRAQVVLQRWNGQEWLEVEKLDADSGGETAFFVKFKEPAKTPIRAVITAPGITYPLEPQTLNVRKAGKKRAVDAADDGKYLVDKSERATAPARFTVANDGKLLRGLRASVPATCRAGAAAVNVQASVALKRARIAPDGTVVGMAVSHGETPAIVTIVGSLHDRHFSGQLTTTYLNCTGSREIDAELGSSR
ncbi:MAG: hypothetical protein JST59_14355 [Actinobacteria bacterium]|nr:hypothetical protein [Actinomycetota bacterium]